jgi:membrane protease YdiL (CAAX protease family)
MRWPDGLTAFGLAVAGTVAIVAALRAGAIPGVVANYAAHAWMAVIAVTWFFLLGRRFPVGGLNAAQLRPWFVVGLILIGVNVVGTIASPPGAGLRLPKPPTLVVAQLVFLAFIVGPTEEVLFRGLIQTSLNTSIRARVWLRSWPIGLGTVVAAALFGLFHLINVIYQPLGVTLQQAGTAVVIGLVFGVLYDRTKNLVGASLVHSVADFSGTAVPLLAYALTNH